MSENKTLKRIENYIFDLDGTLINTGNFILTSLKMSFDAVGINIDASKIHKRIIGPPLETMIKSLDETISDDSVSRVVDAMRRIQLELPESEYPSFEGVLSVVQQLKNNNKRLFVATNRGKMTVSKILKANGLYELFDDIYTIDKYDDRKLSKSQMIQEIMYKYGLDRLSTVMVGDTEEDLNGAKSVGCDFIGVSWGYAVDKHKFEQDSKYYVTAANQIILP